MVTMFLISRKPQTMAPLGLGSGMRLIKITPLERKIELLRLLQGKRMRIGELAEHFGVDERTTRTDVQDLRDGSSILGVKVQIESRHEGEQRHYYTSNVHPLLLALNSSELYALLRLLEDAMARREGEVYRHIFAQLYGQTTDYALALFAGKLRGDHTRKPASNLLEEAAFARSQGDKFVYWEKSGRFLPVHYPDESGKPVEAEAKLKRINGSELSIIDRQGNVRAINLNDIFVDWSAVRYK